MKIFVLVVFVVAYALIVAMPKRKTVFCGIFAAISCGVLIAFGYADFKFVIEAIDFNVVMMLTGFMVTVSLFNRSKMPEFIADKLISKMPTATAAFVFLAVLSGIISAFIDNVATVLMLAPIGLAVARKTGVSPIPVIISIAVSSNLQGAATLVGDTTSVMLGSYADMSFSDFFFLDGRFSIFWATEIGALLTVPLLIFIFRKHNTKLNYVSENVEVTGSLPTVLLLSTVLLMIGFSFVPGKPAVTNGLICVSVAAVGVALSLFRDKGKEALAAVREIDYLTVLFLVFLFLLISCVEKVGIIEDISKLFAEIGNKNVFLLYTVIVFGSVLFSAFIDNIPYVATMLPVIKGLSAGALGVSPYLFYFGMLVGATLGGNLTPVGAQANIVGMGILNKEGEKVKNKDFFKIGVPFTLIAVTGGYLFCWLVWGI